MADAHDAIALLKADHRKVEDLFAKFEAAREADKKQRLAKLICTELTSTPSSKRKSSIRHARARSKMT